jgi:hypothetical protein
MAAMTVVGSLTPFQPRHIFTRTHPVMAEGRHMENLATPSECRAQAAHCRRLAATTADERVRALLVAAATMWTKLAEREEQRQRIKA